MNKKTHELLLKMQTNEITEQRIYSKRAKSIPEIASAKSIDTL